MTVSMKWTQERSSFPCPVLLCCGKLNSHYRMIANFSGASKVYMRLLEVGKETRMCNACQRHLDDAEYLVFENHVSPIDAVRAKHCLVCSQLIS